VPSIHNRRMAGKHACGVLMFSSSSCCPFSTISYLRLLSSFLSLLILIFPISTSKVIFFHFLFLFLIISSLYCFLPFHSSTILLSHPPFYYLLLLYALYLLLPGFLYLLFSQRSLLHILGVFQFHRIPVSIASQNFFEIFLSSLCRPRCNRCVFRPHSHLQFHTH